MLNDFVVPVRDNFKRRLHKIIIISFSVMTMSFSHALAAEENFNLDDIIHFGCDLSKDNLKKWHFNLHRSEKLPTGELLMKYDKGLSYAILQKGSEKLIVKELFFEGNQIKNLNIFKKKYSISYFSNKIKYQKDRKNNLFYSDNFESDSLVLTEKNGYIFSAKWICAEGL